MSEREYPDMDTAYEAGVEDGTAFANLHAKVYHDCKHRDAAPSAALTREALLRLQSDLHGWDMTRGWTAFNVIVARLDEVLEALIGTPPPAPTWKVTGKTLAEWDTGTSTLTSTREETP